MSAKGDGPALGPEKLLAWWGVPNGDGFSDFEARFKRFQEFATDLQKASAEAASHEIAAIYETRGQFIESMRELFQSKGPEQVLAAQAGIAASYFNLLAEQAKRWATFAEKAHACCSELALEAADASRKTKDVDAGRHVPRAPHAREAPRQAAE